MRQTKEICEIIVRAMDSLETEAKISVLAREGDIIFFPRDGSFGFLRPKDDGSLAPLYIKGHPEHKMFIGAELADEGTCTNIVDELANILSLRAKKSEGHPSLFFQFIGK